MSPRILVAGVGNVLLGDDGFGCAVVRACREKMPPGIEVVDFGIRGFDLAYALTSGVDAAIVVDAMPRGGDPGTLYVLDPDDGRGDLPIDVHALHSSAAFALARSLGVLPRVRVIGCEPATIFFDDAPIDALSDAVRDAIPRAVTLTRELAMAFTAEARRA